ncbi:MAG: trehalose-6-phosphate synthase [Pseudomonadota bacterium]
MSRLFVLSNRLPTGDSPSGGLIVALHDCLKERGGVWVGAAEDTVDVPSRGLTQIGSGDYSRMTFDLTQAEHQGFYLGYANSVLWPLFHWRSDLIDLNAVHADIYREVNARVARLLADEVAPDDMIWVHDYHFLPVAGALRDLGVQNRIGFFLHTPFPHAQDLLALPERSDFCRWLAAFDLVGVQTRRDVAAMLELYRGTDHAEMMLDGTLRYEGRRFATRSFPIGIDVADFIWQAELSDGATTLGLPDDAQLIIGVDRLDYTKGLVNRFEAFGTYLDQHANAAARPTLLQIAQPSREAIDTYQDIRAALEATTGRLNGTHGQLDWTPIRYINRGLPRAQIAGLYRRADVGLVTPLADGMNLVAKEYVAAQNPDDPGVLILSHFAGAAEQMQAALLVNPYDIDEVAAAIDTALTMPRAERQDRHADLLAGLRRDDIDWWTDAFLDALAAPDVLAA